MNLIGKTVFVIGNNFEEPINVGTLKSFGIHGMPIVEVNGKEYTSFGMLIPYSDRLNHMIRDLSKREIWEMFREIKIFWSDLDEAMINAH